jgi:hypothetical protein
VDEYCCRHVSLSNPLDETRGDLPLLLRRVAELIEAEGIDPMDLLDLVVHQEMTAEGPWWDITIYWSTGEEGPRSN